VALVTGGAVELSVVRQVARRFTLDARIVAVRVTSRRHGFQIVQNTAVYDVAGFDELPAVVTSGMRS
jgi:hypothetical protein